MNPRTVMYLAIGSVVLTVAIVVVIYLLGRGFLYAAPKGREPSWFRRVRESRFGFMIPVVLIPGLYLLFIIPIGKLISGGSVWIRVLDNLPMACMYIFFSLVARARVPVGGLLCAKCKYNVESLSPPVPEGQPKRSVHDVVCPECGSQFGWPGGTISEHHEWRWSRLIVPAIFLLPMVIQFASIPLAGILWWKSAIHRVVPTESLIQEATVSRSFTMAAWDELSRRELTAEQNHRIAEKLLSPPPRQYFSPDERKWLSTAIAARAIDPELIRPWLERLLVVSRSATEGDRRVQIKCETAYLMPFNDMCITLNLITEPVSKQKPLTIKMAGSQPYNAYWLGTLPDGTTRAWVDAAVHIPGEVVATGEAGEEMEKSGKTLYFLRIPVIPLTPGWDAPTPAGPVVPGMPGESGTK